MRKSKNELNAIIHNPDFRKKFFSGGVAKPCLSGYYYVHARQKRRTKKGGKNLAKDERLEIRVSTEEKRRLEEEADYLGMKYAELVRRRVFGTDVSMLKKQLDDIQEQLKEINKKLS